jgi:hypothetical protein
MRDSLTALLIAGSLAVSCSTAIRAADRAEITFSDGGVFPESVTSTRDGTLFFSSAGRNSVYRAGPDSSQADVWITLGSPGDQWVTGVFADEQVGTLWVCTSANQGRNGAPRTGETALRAFSLSNKAPRGVYHFQPTASAMTLLSVAMEACTSAIPLVAVCCV